MFRVFAFAAFACSLVFGAGPAAADPVADFYKGKTVSLIIGYSVGGGADLWARFIARHLGRHIPGNPNVIVQNMPGGSGLAAVNYLYNAVPQDGTRIILPSVSVPTAASSLPSRKLSSNWLPWLSATPCEGATGARLTKSPVDVHPVASKLAASKL